MTKLMNDETRLCGAVVWFDSQTGFADYCTLPLGHEGTQPEHVMDPDAPGTNGFGHTANGWHSHR